MAITTRSGLDTAMAWPTIYGVQKTSVTTEAAGLYHCHIFGGGWPTAATVPSPGTAGALVNGTNTNGFLPYVNPSSANKYLAGYRVQNNQGNAVFLIDILWWNSGLTVTTTTEQTFTSAAVAARDDTGTTNGAGVQAGILVSTATTNAGAITNMAYRYTDSGGGTGNTATIQSFPATAVAGTLVPFPLAAGDSGVRVIEGVTLGTSLVTGAVHLILFRRLAVSCPVTPNTADDQMGFSDCGLRLYDNSALTFMTMQSATSSVNSATVTLIEG
jgi:hypothetical protein